MQCKLCGRAKGEQDHGNMELGGEAGSHLNTESGVFRNLPAVWSTVRGASNLSAGH